MQTKLKFDKTHFILVVTDDNAFEKFFIADTYKKCYDYLLNEYFEGDEEYLKECEDEYGAEDMWYEEDSCWHFRIEQGIAL